LTALAHAPLFLLALAPGLSLEYAFQGTIRSGFDPGQSGVKPGSDRGQSRVRPLHEGTQI